MNTGLIVALDDPDIRASEILAKQLGGRVSALKIGLTLFSAHGPRAIEAIGAHGEVFCDFKLHDIPNQVRGAAQVLAGYGIWMFTVHASGGDQMVQAAVVGAGKAPGRKPIVAGVTVLTSLDEGSLALVGQDDNPNRQVERLARLAMDAGAGAIVCSANEIETLRHALGEEIVLVAPGIRPEGADAYDQARTMTPLEAASKGANYVVVGRPITLAEEPVAAAEAILKDISIATHETPNL